MFQLPDDFDPSTDAFPSSPEPIVPLKHTIVYVRTFNAPSIESDGTGNFPVTSKSGNKFINVAYFSCANYIKLTPAASTSAKAEVSYYTHLLEFARKHQLTVSIVKLDNTFSKEVEAFLSLNKAGAFELSTELVSPGSHRPNKSERCIGTGKDHFISTICGTDPNFPLDFWDELTECCNSKAVTVRGQAADKRLNCVRRQEVLKS